MEINPSEVTKILKEQIKKYGDMVKVCKYQVSIFSKQDINKKNGN